MQLTVLGCQSSRPRDGQPCSGYLVDTETTRILLDCGPGILTALSSVAEPESLDAVIISHMHTDHYHDLLPLGKSMLSAIAQYPGAPGQADQPPVKLPMTPLYVPSGASSLLQAWASLTKVETIPLLNRAFDGAFDLREYQPGDTFSVGDATVELFGLRHARPNCGIRVTSRAGTLAYTGDTGVTDGLTQLADGVDLLLAEASLDHTDLGAHGHLCAADAAHAAKAGGVGELVLTHMATATDETIVKARVAEAARIFPGRVSAAVPGACFQVGA